jgi:hypothetical protein
MIKHWKTSLAGVGCIVFGLFSMHATYNSIEPWAMRIESLWSGQIALIVVGIGLLFAADHNKTKS